MKKITLSLVMIVLAITVIAQSPQALKYQAVASDNAGNILANQNVSFKIVILKESILGPAVYKEIHVAITNESGLVALEIGNGNVTFGVFEEIDWGNESHFLKILMDENGGTNYQFLGTSQLLSVPYSLYSESTGDISRWRKNNDDLYYNNGNIGIGTISPAYPLSIQPGTSTTGLYIDHTQTDAGNTKGLLIDLDKTYAGDSKIYGGTLWITNNNGSGDTWGLYSSASGTSSGIKYGVYGKASGSGTLWAGYFAGGNVHIANQLGIGTTAPATNLVVKSSGYAHGVHVLANDDEYIFRVRQMSGGGGGIYLFDASENSTILLNGEGDCWINSGRLGIGTATPASRLDVKGNVTIRDISTGEIAIELGKGLDYAEGFNVSDKTNIQPGTILCIDPENPGKLKISENAYDKAVAGIAAGANGLGSGVRLGTQEFDCDVALAGRVYCNTIATTENIEPGDMLTTSSIPGFAMKVTDFENAHGAILGKAMESLEKGKKGQILVLVTLH